MHFVSILVLLVTVIANIYCTTPCPSSETILPCVCTNYIPDSVLLYCKNLTSQEQLSSIITSIPLPHITWLEVSLSHLGYLNFETFGGKTFSTLVFTSNYNLSIPAPSTYQNLSDNLVKFTLSDNQVPILTLEWQQLQVLAKVTDLDLSRNGITMLSFGTEAQDFMHELRILSLSGNKLVHVPRFPELRNLAQLELQSNNIETIEVSSFVNLPLLGRLILSGNELNELPSGILQVPDVIEFLDLSFNHISHIAPDAISAPASHAVLNLDHNSLNELREDVFRSMISGFTTGHLTIKGNPLDCSCSLKWLITDPALLGRVRNGACYNGTVLEQLDSNYYETECP